jgi:hypothetical protein
MTSDDDDDDLVSIYRGLSLERPDRALDQKILRAARRARIGNNLLPIALALAAGLTLAWITPWHAARPAFPYHRAASSEAVPGLYDGRIAQQLADPAMTRQSTFEQMPGGTEGETHHGS